VQNEQQNVFNLHIWQDLTQGSAEQ